MFVLEFADLPDSQMSGTLRGLIAAMYWIGGILALPIVGIINDKLGRRWPIFIGSSIMICGAIIQGFAVNGKSGPVQRKTTAGNLN